MAWVLVIPLLPALAFVAMAPMSRELRNRLKWLPLAAMSGSLALAVAAFATVWPGGEEPAWEGAWALADIGGRALELTARVDAISVIMLIVITVVGVCVQVYSLGYMHKDSRRGWYFAVLSLFSAAMLLLVLAGDFLLLYMSWEVMGLCSYLLIGFWNEMDGPRAASIKAFLTTRVGDVGFAIGLAVMWATAGTFSMHAVSIFNWAGAPAAAAAVALLLFFGAMGKSAQVPLHTWLPDAMAGPTPASALIHAATMVAAGVYLVARAMPIFVGAAEAELHIVMTIGIITALVGGILAVVQYDIKKILAYSTISQLGFMFVALGAGSTVAAMFHLVTHAFFKSLLFLGAGVIIHATHTQDIREMGGLRRAMPWTTATFTVGALALAGLPGLSGFFSKDEILVSILHAQERYYALEWRWALIVLLLAAAGLTAFYMTRLWIRVFGDNACSLAREGHAEMLAPMGVLAAITVAIGWTQPVFMTFMGEHGAWPDPLMAGLSVLVFAAGVGGGYLVYGRHAVDTEALKARFPYAYGVLVNRLYFDITYDAVLVQPFRRLACRLAAFDGSVIDAAVNGAARAWSQAADALWAGDVRFIDGAVNGVGRFVKWAGSRVREIESGRVQTYQRLAFAGLMIMLLVLLLVPILRGA
ncbi:MAG: NADH-quinone oxidoreductase subunit L [Coriobacteriia bacterium]|nr:NADH-quinone oxidoreductase subunit L [Coriobacteriia bacterium]